MIDVKDLENKIINADCMDILKQLPDKCVDLILTDPPYLYTKEDFDKIGFWEKDVFSELERVLKNNSFIVFFGYSDSFFRWNMICQELGLNFVENPVWNKINFSNPTLALPRQIEQISIRRKGNKKLNKVYVNYIQETVNLEAYYQLINTCKRINSLLNTNLDLAKDFINTNELKHNKKHNGKFDLTVSKQLDVADRGVESLRLLKENKKCMTTLITEGKDSVYENIHPTQKPVGLFEKLLKLTTDENDLVLDCFSGSGTTAIACHRLNRRFICIEKDKEYWKASVKRLEDERKQLTLF